MNLSNILGQVTDVARTYYDIRGMRNNPYRDARPIMAQPVDYQVGPYTGNIIGGRMGRVTPGGIIGGAVGGGVVDFLGEMFSGDDPMQMPAGVCKPSDIVYTYDECTQTYVPKKKRKTRRKQLVTKGDIKGLAALKGVVGTGKIMETWIATHV